MFRRVPDVRERKCGACLITIRAASRCQGVFSYRSIRLLKFFYSKLTCFPAQPWLSEAGYRGDNGKTSIPRRCRCFFAVGTGMILYEVARNKANRPILNGGNAIQLYYCGYLSSFVLGTVCVVAAMVK